VKASSRTIHAGLGCVVPVFVEVDLEAVARELGKPTSAEHAKR
jgi:hypothetical protein